MAQFHANISGLFGHLRFFKLGKVIKEKAEEKIKLLEAKIEERKARIVKLRKDHDITDADLIELLSDKARQSFSNQGTYTLSNKAPSSGNGQQQDVIIAAGVINNLNTENTLIGQEKEHVARLTLIARNIDVEEKHEVDFAELEYLGL